MRYVFFNSIYVWAYQLPTITQYRTSTECHLVLPKGYFYLDGFHCNDGNWAFDFDRDENDKDGEDHDGDDDDSDAPDRKIVF